MQNAIFAPFFAMMFLTLVVWVYLSARRILYERLIRLSGRFEFRAPSGTVTSTPDARATRAP